MFFFTKFWLKICFFHQIVFLKNLCYHNFWLKHVFFTKLWLKMCFFFTNFWLKIYRPHVALPFGFGRFEILAQLVGVLKGAPFSGHLSPVLARALAARASPAYSIGAIWIIKKLLKNTKKIVFHQIVVKNVFFFTKLWLKMWFFSPNFGSKIVFH